MSVLRIHIGFLFTVQHLLLSRIKSIMVYFSPVSNLANLLVGVCNVQPHKGRYFYFDFQLALWEWLISWIWLDIGNPTLLILQFFLHVCLQSLLNCSCSYVLWICLKVVGYSYMTLTVLPRSHYMALLNNYKNGTLPLFSLFLSFLSSIWLKWQRPLVLYSWAWGYIFQGD